MASINDKLTQATNSSRPVPTTLTASRSVSASSISCGALTGWPTATAVHFIIYRIDANSKKVAGSQTDWKGVVSGTTITGLVLKGGTDLGDSIGAVVEAAPTAAWANDVVSWGTQEHNQDGTHSNVTATSVTATGTISATGGISDAGVTSLQMRQDTQFDFVASGAVIALVSALTGSFTDAAYWINGARKTKTGVSNRAYTASKDTYVDIDASGTLTYTEVSNNAASPALTAGNLRLAIVTTSGAAITNVNQGQESQVIPIASSVNYSVTDSLGNLVYNTDPQKRTVGYRQNATSNFTGSGTAEQVVTGMSMPVICDGRRKIKLTLVGCPYNTSTTNQVNFKINEGATVLNRVVYSPSANNLPIGQMVMWEGVPTAGTHIYTATVQVAGGSPGVEFNSTEICILKAELV